MAQLKIFQEDPRKTRSITWRDGFAWLSFIVAHFLMTRLVLDAPGIARLRTGDRTIQPNRMTIEGSRTKINLPQRITGGGYHGRNL